MPYPVNINFKIIALAEQMSVTDAAGKELFYIKQKMFKLKEKIEVFTDRSKTELLYTVQADRVLDFSPEYTLRDAAGIPVGTIKRHGKRSLWRASYDITLGGQHIAHIGELNPWAKVMDNMFGEIPILGLLTGFLFHPMYSIRAADDSGRELGRIHKQRAFFEGRFAIYDGGLSQFDVSTQRHIIALIMVAVLMERNSG